MDEQKSMSKLSHATFNKLFNIFNIEIGESIFKSSAVVTS
jgi:hypothetical protein